MEKQQMAQHFKEAQLLIFSITLKSYWDHAYMPNNKILARKKI